MVEVAELFKLSSEFDESWNWILIDFDVNLECASKFELLHKLFHFLAREFIKIARARKNCRK
jgi:hypothetical protein